MNANEEKFNGNSKYNSSSSSSQSLKNEEEENKVQCKSKSNVTDVKSTAVVKYSMVEVPAMFTRLRCNTNLNLPPSNWLSNSAEPYGLQPALPGNRSGFSSFRMAHMFPDCVGAVDVVSDAENIKKLLKIPYSRGPVSMMVHRIENTLLIDEFDFHKYLLREAESQWKMFKKFFIDHMRQTVNIDKTAVAKDKSRTSLQQKSLVSKFLYHSLVLADEAEDKKPFEPDRVDPAVPIPLPYKNTEPPLPEPTLEEELPDPTSNHQYARNVVWTFEDIQMLLGTDLPIFGGGTHPCISLRLRDMAKPINVLTGMDYWLDNLMCNVPEVVMCYHLDGIVQRYELIKTEDLPNLEHSKFSPKVVRDIAQNILSFLKANATKAGHTYWLFKGKDDDVVKLYDLSSLCTETLDEKGQTPFTVPVAMLLYRVARNMKNSPDDANPRHNATIRMLLKNCIALLSAEKYPQIVTSAHYMLADLYIPSDINPASPNLSKEEETEDEDASASRIYEEGNAKNELVKELCLSSLEEHLEEMEYIPPPPPLSSDLETRCKEALTHVLEGLRSLRFINEPPPPQDSGTEPEMAKPFNTIPMPYPTADTVPGKKKQKKKKKGKMEDYRSLLRKPQAEAVPSWRAQSGISWNIHLKVLLYDKACLVYATKFEGAYSAGKFGTALRFAALMLKIQYLLRKIKPDSGDSSYLLGRVGDALCMVVQKSSTSTSHAEAYEEREDIDKEMEEALKGKGAVDLAKSTGLPDTLGSLEEMMMLSAKCYRRALESVQDPGEAEHGNLQRRLGNIENELGVFYMNKAATTEPTASQADKTRKKDFKQWFAESLAHLDAGLRAFETVKDEANTALLHSNTGRLMRLRAHFHSGGGEMTIQERHFYNKALASYQRAFNVLGSRRDYPLVWDSVTWEMSTALFTMATLLQDFPSSNKGQDDTEREVIDMFHRALKHCDLDTPGARLPVYQYRYAMIHHRLGSLYHKSYRSCTEEESRRKKLVQLCKLHYDKAAKMLTLLEQHTGLLRVQLEQVALAEFQSEGASSTSHKVRHLHTALNLLLECKAILQALSEDSAGKIDGDGQVTQAECEDLKLLGLWKDRMQFVLLSLTRLSPQIGKPKELCDTYKTMYAVLLRTAPGRDTSVSQLAAGLYQFLEKHELNLECG